MARAERANFGDARLHVTRAGERVFCFRFALGYLVSGLCALRDADRRFAVPSLDTRAILRRSAEQAADAPSRAPARTRFTTRVDRDALLEQAAGLEISHGRGAANGTHPMGQHDGRRSCQDPSASEGRSRAVGQAPNYECRHGSARKTRTPPAPARVARSGWRAVSDLVQHRVAPACDVESRTHRSGSATSDSASDTACYRIAPCQSVRISSTSCPSCTRA